MNKNNFVSARSTEKRMEAVSLLGDIIPPFQQEQAQPWGMPPGRLPQSNVDPFRKGLEFNTKYAPLAIAVLVLSVGLTMRLGQDFTWGIVLFGLLLFVGYWLLGMSENFFDRDSGHVVWALFGWLVEWVRAHYRDKAHARIIEAEKEIRMMQLLGDEDLQQILAERRAEIERRHALPQSGLNRLASFDTDDSAEHPPVSAAALKSVAQIQTDELDPPTWAKPVEKNNGSKALAILLDFVEDLYSHPSWINAEGLLLVGVPWSKSGTDRHGVNVPSPVKRQIVDALSAMTPPLFVYVEDSRQWKLNIADYPAVEDAYTVIDESPMRKA